MSHHKKSNHCHKCHGHKSNQCRSSQCKHCTPKLHGSITSLVPNSGPSSGNNFILINGYDLIFTTNVMMNNINIPFTILSNTQIQIIAIPQTGPSTVNITVKFKNDYYESLPYNYSLSPIITSLNPSSGPTTGNNIISIIGSNLFHTKIIYFNNISTFSFYVVSDTQLQVAVPNLTGNNDINVHVESKNGSSNSLPYELILPPMI